MKGNFRTHEETEQEFLDSGRKKRIVASPNNALLPINLSVARATADNDLLRCFQRHASQAKPPKEESILPRKIKIQI